MSVSAKTKYHIFPQLSIENFRKTKIFFPVEIVPPSDNSTTKKDNKKGDREKQRGKKDKGEEKKIYKQLFDNNIELWCKVFLPYSIYKSPLSPWCKVFLLYSLECYLSIVDNIECKGGIFTLLEVPEGQKKTESSPLTLNSSPFRTFILSR